MTKYTIELQAENLSEYVPLKAQSNKEAMNLVKQYLSLNSVPKSTLVYLQFFRTTDHQSGYINPDGTASLTGKPWTGNED